MKLAHVYGIKNCNTVKKALLWLEDHQIAFEFHDFKKEGVSDESLKNWFLKSEWQTLVNKKGTTWRKLDLTEQLKIQDKASAITALKQHTSMIKRPVIEYNGHLLVGFEEKKYEEVFQK